eukprot:273522-Hanusia_phi.AAC.1
MTTPEKIPRQPVPPTRSCPCSAAGGASAFATFGLFCGNHRSQKEDLRPTGPLRAWEPAAASLRVG